LIRSPKPIQGDSADDEYGEYGNMSYQTKHMWLTDPQADLLAYWQSKLVGNGCARREDMHPGELRSMLANLSVVELSEDGHARFRLAGSKLRAIVGMEARGRTVTEIQGGELEPWCDALLGLLDNCQPASGVSERGDKLHVWLRLPLLDARGRMTQIMCHDALVSKAASTLREREFHLPIHGAAGRYAA